MNTDISQNNKRIAKNTIILYFRMIITTLVSLYTARLMLQLLGVEDFGIYNVVGGIIGFMAIITGTMTSATMRFLAYDLGKKDILQYQRTFSMLINMFLVFCLLTIIIMEIVGPSFISEHLVIPNNRMYAAQWIFQYTIITFCFTTMEIPFTASVVSYEKMNIYAYFTFVDVGFKLAAVLTLYITPIDKLITYGTITMLCSILKTSIMFIYCLRKLEGCRYIKYWDKTLFRKMSSYTGWNLFGSTTSVLNNQGQAILLNIFFGPFVNASKAIADKINHIIYSFCQNFFMAVNPQIIKTYAGGNLDQTVKLVYKSSKLSFFLYMVLAFPLMYNMESILRVWLGSGQVSLEMVRFCQFTLLMSFSSPLESPITQIVRANGNIKKYQIYVGVQTLSFLPICFIAFKFGMKAYYSMLLLSIIYFVALVYRIYYVMKILPIKFIDYIKYIISPILVCIILSVIVIESCVQFIVLLSIWYYNFIFVFTAIVIVVYNFGITKNERNYINKGILKILKR